MKKSVGILALVLVAVMALLLVGCSPESKIKGEWEGELDGVEVAFEFEDDEVKMTFEYDGTKESETLEYEFKDDKLYIEDEKVKYEFKDKNTLILEIDEEEIELERVK